MARSGKSRHGNLRGQVGQETSPQRCRIVQVSGTQAWVGLRSDSYVCTLHARSDHHYHHPHHKSIIITRTIIIVITIATIIIVKALFVPRSDGYVCGLHARATTGPATSSTAETKLNRQELR